MAKHRDSITARAVLKPRKVRPFFGRHPWVLDSAIDHLEGRPGDGEVVELVSDKGQAIAWGIYNSQSRIRVRLYSWAPGQLLDDAFWHARLETAVRLRRQLGLLDPQGAVRLVASEADGLGGLVVDRYADQLVVQVTALAMAVRLEQLLPMLVDLLAPRGILLRTDRATARREGPVVESLEQGPAWGEVPDGPVFISEHGLRYGVDLRSGQKTGFYLDQRDNRRAAARYMSGRRVLDMCCYSGAFALSASVLGGAHEVLGIDSSAKAIALAQANAQLNGVTNARFQEGDCFAALESLAEGQEQFGAVVLDPPKFASQRQGVDKALKAYHQLNRLAVDLLESDGILVTCSCSGYVGREDFLYMLAEVAQRSGRDIQVLQQRRAAADHPLSVTCLESEYLKCFICRVV